MTTSRTRPRVAGERGRARPTAARHTTTTSQKPTRTSAPRPAPGPAPRPAPSRVAGPPRTGRARWVVPLAALVVALVALATVLGVALRDPDAQARLDRAAASQARTSIEQMLSYNYKTIDAQSAQIETLLTGAFKGEFSTAMDRDIKPLAVKNQTVVQAKVSDVGVMSSSPTTVKVLAFVNQARVGADQKEPVVDQNRVIATMTKVGDRWLVSRVDAF